ncbi:Mu-like prophage major head subunit gpT family protein [Variovorax gossypii]
MLINAANLTILRQAFNAAFKNGFKTVTPHWSRIATPVPSTTGEEKYGWLGKTTKFREWIGDRQYQNLKVHDYAIKNKTFENTVTVPRDDIDDDTYGVYNMPMQLLGEDAALHPDELVFKLLAQGETTKCYDGQFFFDTDHPVGLEGQVQSVSNHGGGSGTGWYLLNVGKLLKPVILQQRRAYAFKALTSPDDPNVFDKNEFVYGADGRSNVGFGLWHTAFMSKQTLDATGYAAARTAMFGFKFDNGQPVNQGGKFLLVVPPALENAALNVVTAERLANGADNVYRNTAEVMVCPWLT